MNNQEAVNSYAEQGLSPVRELLTSEDVNEVVINPDGRIFVERAGAAHMEPFDNVTMTEREIRSLGSNLAGETRNTLGEDHPIVSGRVRVFGADMRVQVVVPPAVEEGVSLSIRKYISHVLKTEDVKFLRGKQVDVDGERLQAQRALLQLVETGNLSELFRSSIDRRLNIVISGGTSSGKTTVARALLSLVDEGERLVTIEDAVELRPTHTNTVALVANRREGSDRTPGKLLESALRMRPDRLVLGEIRGAEAYNFLEAINTGHPGSLTTIHADSPVLALERLALMVMQTGVRLTKTDVIEYAKQTIDMIVQVGREGGRRGVLEIYMPSIEEKHERALVGA